MHMSLEQLNCISDAIENLQKLYCMVQEYHVDREAAAKSRLDVKTYAEDSSFVTIGSSKDKPKIGRFISTDMPSIVSIDIPPLPDSPSIIQATFDELAAYRKKYGALSETNSDKSAPRRKRKSPKTDGVRKASKAGR